MPAYIDKDHLERYVTGDDALRDEILSIFHDRIEELRVQIDPGMDDTGWHDIMHAMKGASRGVGAWEVGDLCETGEALTGSEKLADRHVLATQLQDLLTAVLAEARHLRDQAAA